MFSLNNGVAIPKFVSLYILSFLDDKDLRAVEQVDKRGQALASNSTLWENLFKRVFEKEPPKEMHGKEAFMRQKVTKNCCFEEIPKIYANFLCDLQWDKKRLLEIKIPDGGCLVVEEGYGPNCGNEEIFNKKSPDSKWYYNCIDIPGEFSYNNISSNITIVSEKNDNYNNPQIHSKITLKTFYDSSLIDLANIKKPPSEGYSTTPYINVSIANIDVGFGNSLAYFSSVNDWKKPLKLFCEVQNTRPKWVGRLPGRDFYKFVKVDSEGKITWEIRADNRKVSSYRSIKNDYALNNPQIEFPQ